MIIYGDSHYESSWEILRSRLQERISRTNHFDNPDQLRALLIQAGQLEQAVQDATGCNDTGCDSIQKLTEGLAQAFFESWTQSLVTEPQDKELWPRLQIEEEVILNVKVPEGFAYYALFPEQYIAAALNWARQQSRPAGQVVVVGVRSIGTSLSALVCATLSAQGWKVRRFTVRPMGSAFERQAALKGIVAQEGELAVVVDEGPGLSGSSMASVAQALVERGFSRQSITFLPGHSGEPGQFGSENVRQWWSTTPRFVTPLGDVRWKGRTLKECLADVTETLRGQPVEHTEDWGGGLWRQFVYTKSHEFPSVAPAFENPKFLCRLRDGSAVLWKFAGLAVLADGRTGAESAFVRMQELAQRGWSPAPLGVSHGFVAMPWIEGRPLQRSDGTPKFLGHAGKYLASSAQEPFARENQIAALKRMGEWLYWNTWEALGEEVAERTRVWSERALEAGAHTFPTYGDGRMAPHEWRQTQDGRYWKLDNYGHDTDHTVIGRQTLTWDVAGLIIEWDLNARQTEFVLCALAEAGGPQFPPEFLQFHCLGYTAFRLGLLTMARMGADATEQERLQKAIDFYREVLLHELR